MDHVLLLTVTEASQRLGISRTKCYSLVAAEVLPSVRIGRSVRVPVLALARWVEEHTSMEKADTGTNGPPGVGHPV